MTLHQITDLPWEAVSHNPEIKKRVVLRNGDVDNLTHFAQAHFTPGQFAPSHSHPDMTEIFFVTSGTATAIVDGTKHVLTEGSCLVVQVGEEHEMRNDSDEDLLLTYFCVRA